jgi:HAD superfamily hydrolase (TIGR01490 family)
MQKVAFFDIDGTVFRSSLLIELVDAFIEAEIFPKDSRNLYEEGRVAWTNREGSYDLYIDGVVKAFVTHIQGVHYSKLAEIGKQVVEKQSKRVYRYTRDLIEDLKSQDYYIVAISQSPKTVLDEFCKAYGFDKVYGRMYEIGPRDCFTGKVLEEELIRDKSIIVKRVMEKNGFTLEGSIGVGDTDGDIPLLNTVETPICFNPNMKLYEYAKERQWPIIVERKDVVYTL